MEYFLAANGYAISFTLDLADPAGNAGRFIGYYANLMSEDVRSGFHSENCNRANVNACVAASTLCLVNLNGSHIRSQLCFLTARYNI